MYESEKMSTFSMFIYLCVNTNSILKRGLCGTRQVILKSMWRKKEGEPRNCENKEKWEGASPKSYQTCSKDLIIKTERKKD